MRNKVIIVVVIAVVGYFALAILSNQKFERYERSLTVERFSRFTAEEKLEQSLGRIKSLESRIFGAQNQIEKLQTELDQEQNKASSLSLELEKVTKLKDILEQELKNALVGDPAQASTEGP